MHSPPAAPALALPRAPLATSLLAAMAAAVLVRQEGAEPWEVEVAADARAFSFCTAATALEKSLRKRCTTDRILWEVM